MITALSGPNSFALQAELIKRITAYKDAYGDIGLERRNAAESSVTQLLESVQAMPFLSEKRLLIIENIAANKELPEKIKKMLELVNDQTDLLLLESKLDKRSILYKTLKKETNYIECAELDESSIVTWMQAYTKEQGGTMDAPTTRHLLQAVGSNQQKLSHEISKLVSFNPVITKSTIDLLTEKTPQSSIFDLLDAAFAGNHRKSLGLYAEQRSQKVEPQAILALLVWQLHIIAVVKSAGNKPVDTIATSAKLNPYVVRKTAGLARSITGSQIKDLIRRTVELDARLKSVSIDADEAMQNLLISL